jgi:putative transcription factor
MCGKETNLFKTVIEGTELRVCKDCSKFGKIIGRIAEPVKEKKKKHIEEEREEPEIVEEIVPDYASKVKSSRESRGLKQEELAKKLSEKESVIHKIETGHYEPNLVLAKKLERFLKITLIESHEIEKPEKSKKATADGPLTIGDMIKIKK